MSKEVGYNFIFLESVWMDMLRGLAILSVVIHHWLLFIPYKSSPHILFSFAELIQNGAGTTVHLFFILSGCGLTLSYFKKGAFSWGQWVRRRFGKIVVPLWVIITLTFVLVNLLHAIHSEIFETRYTWLGLFTYLTFTRNFYIPAWGLNPTLWFMPVIFGLYVLFPLLIKVIEKYGALALFGISIIITYSSITICLLLDYTVSHQTALFLFFVVEFALGMCLGYVMCFDRSKFSQLLGPKMFISGLVFYCVSWIITRIWSLGDAYNDLMTALGVFLITINICKWIIRFSPKASVKILRHISKESYLMYLMHGSVILLVAKPLLAQGEKLPLHPLMALILSGLYCAAIFGLAKIMSPAMNAVSSRFYRPN